MNIVIFLEKKNNIIMSSDNDIFDAENFTMNELVKFYNNSDYDIFLISGKVTGKYDNDRIKSIVTDENISPDKWFNIQGDPDHKYFSTVDEKFMKKLFKLWDKYGLYQGDENYILLKKKYKTYIDEATIREIVE